VLFKTLGAVDASSPPPGCNPTTDLTTNPQDPNCLGHNAAHIPQPAGLVTMRNTPNLVDAMNGLPPTTLLGVPIRWVCPSSQGYSGILGINGNCGLLSLPRAFNDMFWAEPRLPRRDHRRGHWTAVATEPGQPAADVESGGYGRLRRGRQLLGCRRA